MQDIENNMDELFRKAAGKYPLKTSMDDWDKIAPLLMNSPAVTGNVQKKKNIKKYSSLLLFLFLFLITTVIATKDTDQKTGVYEQSEKKLSPVKMEETGSIKHYTALVYKNQAQKKQRLIHISGIPAQNNQPVKNNTGQHEKIAVVNPVHGGCTDKAPENWLIAKEDILQAATAIKIRPAESIVVDKGGPLTYMVAAHKLIHVLQPINQKDSSDTEKKETAILLTAAKNKPRIYLGIVFGPSFNQVKNQGLKKPGYDIGLLAGYQFTKKLSVETGLLYEKKYYFSDGKYFDMAKVSSNMPAGMKVLSLEGSCAVFEIPFKVKYNLYGRGNRHFYSTAGISTYIVTSEYNKYQAVINGTQQNVTGAYNNTSRYWAAAINAGLGYENRIGKFAHVRIEPYLQVPLKGIGVGSLPVMTAGLHIGFARFAY